MPRGRLLDPQGQAVQQALVALGFEAVVQVRVGRTFEIALDAPSAQQARARLHDMCERLIANPVTEDFNIDAVELAR